MVANVGGADRVIRIIVGIVFLVLGIFALEAVLSVIFIILGVLALLTGLFRYCPGYLPFKFSTGEAKKTGLS